MTCLKEPPVYAAKILVPIEVTAIDRFHLVIEICRFVGIVLLNTLNLVGNISTACALAEGSPENA